jgi:hypothetical protein
MTLTQFYFVVTTLNIVIFSLLYIFIPGLRDTLTLEDHFLENLTTILFFESFLISLFAVTRLQNKFRKKLYVAIPLVGLIGFLDELSFGERLFDFTPPTANGIRVDAAHDLLSVVYKYWSYMPKRGNYLLFACVLFSALLLGFVAFRYKKYLTFNYLQNLFNNLSSKYAPTRFLFASVLFVSLALIIDLEIIHHDFVFFLEELFEMNSGLSLMLASFAIQTELKGSFARNLRSKYAR